MRTKWTFYSLLQEAKKYNSKIEFQKKNHGAYESARIKGILNEICSHMIPTSILRAAPRPNSRKWTKENLFRLAHEYSTRSKFKADNSGAYKAAVKLGILNEICSHMTVLMRIWTNYELQQEAFKFTTRLDFQKGCRKAYEIAIRRGIIEKICSHMKITTRISAMEKELLETIKNIFPDARTFADHRVRVSNKPHIKRFEIDIFVKSAMKGIEFDGTYHHSFTGLLRGRGHWPIEDVTNYHKIKDEYFYSVRGIKILHIKEKDWIQNKDKCVRQCLKFLSK